MKDLHQVTIIGLGLLGGSVSLAVLRSFSHTKVVGYSHRASTRQKARDLAVAGEVAEDLLEAVTEADLVILATPVRTFDRLFGEIAGALKSGCIVTDVGSTKSLVHRWAAKRLGKDVQYVGSHPIAGSEQRGVEFSRDDLFDQVNCILTRDGRTSDAALETVERFWRKLGCNTETMTPARHDRIFGGISHVPHVTAAALVNANTFDGLRYAGKGFMDTSRIASGPANIWADILLTNPEYVARGIDRVIKQLQELRKAIKAGDEQRVTELLTKARKQRGRLVDYKMSRKELD